MGATDDETRINAIAGKGVDHRVVDLVELQPCSSSGRSPIIGLVQFGLARMRSSWTGVVIRRQVPGQLNRLKKSPVGETQIEKGDALNRLLGDSLGKHAATFGGCWPRQNAACTFLYVM